MMNERYIKLTFKDEVSQDAINDIARRIADEVIEQVNNDGQEVFGNECPTVKLIHGEFTEVER